MNAAAFPINDHSVSPQHAAMPPHLATVKASFAYRNRMIFTGICLSLGLIFSAVATPLPRFSLAVEWAIELLGWALFWSGTAIRIWASTYICARKSRAVIATGPYSICRNPLYWGTLLMIGAFPFLIGSPLLAVSMIPPVLLYLFAVVPVEESVMLSRHSEEYADYCRTVSRWWPQWSTYQRGEPVSGNAVGYSREWGRLLWWAGMAIALDMVFHFTHATWWVHPLRLW